jgi:hypothetical protein
MEQIRAKVAAKAGGKYDDLKSIRKTVNEVLKEEGIDFNRWRTERKTRLEAEGKSTDDEELGRMHRDVLDGLLLIQLFPDDIPVFRSIEPVYAGLSGTTGSSWWGIGTAGVDDAMNYWQPHRSVIETTLGALRQAGAVRSDEMAFGTKGNCIELFHRELKTPGANGKDEMDQSSLSNSKRASALLSRRRRVSTMAMPPSGPINKWSIKFLVIVAKREPKTQGIVSRQTPQLFRVAVMGAPEELPAVRRGIQR